MLNDFINNHWPLIIVLTPAALLVAFALGLTVGAWIIQREYSNHGNEMFEAGRRKGLIIASRRIAEQWRGMTAGRCVDAIMHRN